MEQKDLTRRAALKRLGLGGAGLISAPGAYAALERLARPQRAHAAATVRRRQEQYLIDSLEAILDNGVPAIIPPVYNDVVTAKLAPGTSWTTARLKAAASKLEKALQTVESPYPSTAAGLTIVVAWGLPYFQQYASAPWTKYAPIDLAIKQPAVLDAIKFPSDPSELALESNHVAFKLRSDSRSILTSVEKALFD